jgi:predicted AlkP superfamily pyrophosphatase or phosphodiesterase
MSLGRPFRVWLGVGVAVAAVFVASGCGGASPTAPTPASPVAAVPTPPPSPKVVILSIDGLRADAFAQADLPNLKALAARGAFSYSARTVRPSETLPAHASMLSGQDPANHQLTYDWNAFLPEKGYIPVPTALSVARAAGLRTVAVVGKSKLEHLAPPSAVEAFVLASRGDADVANEAVVRAAAGFDLLFVHFPDVDLAGHASGWMSPAYMAKLTEADAAAGRVLAALPPNATVILTADHGGKGTDHAADIPENTTVPWVVAGPKVVRKGQMTSRVKVTDTAVTALWLLGLNLPGSCAGELIREPFTSQ